VKVIVAGSRDLDHMEHDHVIAEAMSRWLREHGQCTPLEQVTVLCGECRGADAIGSAIAQASGMPVQSCPADWKTHGRSAGPHRNQHMVDEADGLVVVRYPDSRGSADVLRRAQAKGIPVVDVVLERPR
jgi:hypothetical protein